MADFSLIPDPMGLPKGDKTADRKRAGQALVAPPATVTLAPAPARKGSDLVRVYEFTDYREYLRAFFEFKRQSHPQYSASLFARRAGLGANSRGYLTLVIAGKRNLTPHTLRGFVQALGLDARGSLYFENMVYFNQARTQRDKEYYFQRLSASAGGHESRPFEILASQYRYYSHWYYVAVLQLIALPSFQEDPAWICRMLRGKIAKKEAIGALEELQKLGFARRGSDGRLVQSEPIVKFNGAQFNPVIQKFHAEMLDRAREALFDDPYEERSVSSVTLSVPRESLAEIRQMVAEFRDVVCAKYCRPELVAETVLQVNFQLFHLTPIHLGERK